MVGRCRKPTIHSEFYNNEKYEFNNLDTGKVSRVNSIN